VQKLLSRTIISVVLAVGVYAVVTFYADLELLWAAIRTFPIAIFAAACALSLANYGLRFVKWHAYLRRLKISLPTGRSAGVFLSGLSMSVTPGKLGELLKAYLLRCSDGVTMTKTAPVVVAERLTDLMAILLLALAGVAAFPSARLVVAVGGALVVALLVIVSSKRLSLWALRALARLPGLKRAGNRMEDLYSSMAELVRPGPLLWGVALSLVSWLFEAVGFYLVLSAFDSVRPGLAHCVFIYAFSTAAGALSFLPGGLGVTEGGMIALVVKTVEGAGRSVGVAATLIIRVATLWLAVVVGFVSLAVMRRRLGASLWEIGRPDEEEARTRCEH
jgi:uncharacterized protein (TIRG00374 family)